MAERLASASYWRLTCYYEPRTVGLAMLTKELPNNECLNVEVIGSVNGLTQKDLVDPDILQLRSGKIYRLPSPIVLLKAKLANVAQIDQTRRQDVRHVKMLIFCVREYPRESHLDCGAGRVTERQLVDLLEAVRALYCDSRNAGLGRKHDFQLSETFPKELSNSTIPKVARFFEYRMTERLKSNDLQISDRDKPASRLPDWSLDSMINPPELDKSLGKSKEPEIEI